MNTLPFSEFVEINPYVKIEKAKAHPSLISGRESEIVIRLSV